MDSIRVALPSGGWWEIKPQPTWADRKKLAKLGTGADPLMAVDAMLVGYTCAWSFSEAVTQDTMDGRENRDVEAVLTRMLKEYQFADIAADSKKA